MNVATWESIYCLFPTGTLCNKQMGVFSAFNEVELKAYDKYVDRGYTVAGFELLGQLPEFQNDRIVGDEWTHRVMFPGAPSSVDLSIRDVEFKVGQGGLEYPPSSESDESDVF